LEPCERANKHIKTEISHPGRLILNPCLRSFAFFGWPFVLDRQSLPKLGYGPKQQTQKTIIKVTEKNTSILVYLCSGGWQKCHQMQGEKENRT